MDRISELTAELAHALSELSTKNLIRRLNEVRVALHAVSPFRGEPVDFVEWVPAEQVFANDYNPNAVAPPEMRLLETSIEADGYTQPIVTHMENEERRVVVDGFHRNVIGRDREQIRERIHGHLPVTRIRAEREAAEDRMASTIRHNRARGTHGVDPMTALVGYMSKKGWDNAKISKELGMEPDEVLRFQQVSGLAELFRDREFSEAWELEEPEKT